MKKNEKQQIAAGLDFNIVLESEEFEARSEHWQTQCNVLYNMIQEELPSGSIQPLSYKSAKGERADLITIFSILAATGITAKAFDRMFDMIKIWLENRPKTKVMIKYPDGSMLELSGLSKSEALKLIEEHKTSTVKHNYG